MKTIYFLVKNLHTSELRQYTNKLSFVFYVKTLLSFLPSLSLKQPYLLSGRFSPAFTRWKPPIFFFFLSVLIYLLFLFNKFLICLGLFGLFLCESLIFIKIFVVHQIRVSRSTGFSCCWFLWFSSYWFLCCWFSGKGSCGDTSMSIA